MTCGLTTRPDTEKNTAQILITECLFSTTITINSKISIIQKHPIKEDRPNLWT